MKKGPSSNPVLARKVAIIGIHEASDAYPNVKYRILALLKAKEISAQEFRYTLRWRPYSNRNRRRQVPRMLSFFGFMLNAIWTHFRAVFACILHARKAYLYVPYPAPSVLFGLSFFPRFLRPRRIITDAFISLYDTVVVDRKLLSRNNILSRILWRIERRAYLLADVVVTDTAMNSRHLGKLFRLPEEKLVALPLAIGEQLFAYSPYQPLQGRCTVLFIGTFVPLQGTDVIARTVLLLCGQPNIHFRIIGNGQTAEMTAKLLDQVGSSHFEWVRNWQEAEVLAAEIRAADICLGIFGTTDKTQRVWPFKNYLYMASGRALITGDTECARELTRQADAAPFVMVPTGSPEALANAILRLASDAGLRLDCAKRSRNFYEQHLANTISTSALVEELLR